MLIICNLSLNAQINFMLKYWLVAGSIILVTFLSAVEQSRLMELDMSCSSLKDCIIFDNGAIDTRMSAAKSAWDAFNEKFGLRKKLLQILVEDFIPPLDKVHVSLAFCV